MPDPSDAVARRGVQLHERLRAFLLATMPHDDPPAIACALMYELVSLAAVSTETEEEALALLRGMFRLGAEQIARLGVGHPHP